MKRLAAVITVVLGIILFPSRTIAETKTVGPGIQLARIQAQLKQVKTELELAKVKLQLKNKQIELLTQKFASLSKKLSSNSRKKLYEPE